RLRPRRSVEFGCVDRFVDRKLRRFDARRSGLSDEVAKPVIASLEQFKVEECFSKRRLPRQARNRPFKGLRGLARSSKRRKQLRQLLMARDPQWSPLQPLSEPLSALLPPTDRSLRGGKADQDGPVTRRQRPSVFKERNRVETGFHHGVRMAMRNREVVEREPCCFGEGG